MTIPIKVTLVGIVTDVRPVPAKAKKSVDGVRISIHFHKNCNSSDDDDDNTDRGNTSRNIN